MLRRTFLQSAAATAVSAQPRRPNLVFILTDDMGYGDLGCYGSHDIRTPHIDRLATQGVRFTDCYANAPVCTPTRVGFLTGRYQQRFGKDLEWALGPNNNKTGGLQPSQSVLPGALKQAGYRSAIVGKWHVGWNPGARPMRHGFDKFFGILLGNADMYTHKYHDGSDDLWENDQPVRKEGYLTDLLAERAVDWIRRNAANPFVLYLPFNAVHWPFQPPGKPVAATAENWRDGNRSDYARMLESVDSAVGKVMDALRSHRLEENTLVVFSNDNGGERLSDSGPLFHVKGTLFEGGIRVPAIARWPGIIPAGRTTRQAAMTMDFTATFLKAAGATAPALDGVDLLPVLSGTTPEFERSLFWRIDQPGRRQLAARRGKWKYIDDNTGNRGFPELLFNLEDDPGERRNLYYRNQEVAAALRKAALSWQEEVARPA
jgi:arylsulfatase A-like enzyme